MNQIPQFFVYFFKGVKRMEHVQWKRRSWIVVRIMVGIALIGTGFFYINRTIDQYAVPFFVDNFSPQTLKSQVRAEKKSFGLFFKRKKKKKQPKGVEIFEDGVKREVLLSVGIKACVGGMLLFIGFLILFLYLGIESIVIGWLLAVQAGYEAYMFYDLAHLMRYKSEILTGGMIGAAIILMGFLWAYVKKYKAHVDSGYHTHF